MMTKKSEELKELHQEKLEKALKEVENIKKYHMEMMRVLSQTVAQVERIVNVNIFLYKKWKIIMYNN